jgi:hypothetical protein
MIGDFMEFFDLSVVGDRGLVVLHKRKPQGQCVPADLASRCYTQLTTAKRWQHLVPSVSWGSAIQHVEQLDARSVGPRGF